MRIFKSENYQTIRLIVFLSAISTINSCDNSNNNPILNNNTTEQINKPHTNKHKENPDYNTVLDIWKEKAKEHNIKTDSINRVASLTQDTMIWQKSQINQTNLENYTKSLNRYLNQFAYIFNDTQRQKGLEYRTAYCITKGFNFDLHKTEKQKILKYYQEILEKTASLITKNTLANLPKEKQILHQKLINKGGEVFKEYCLKRIERYINDFICPSFKQNLSKSNQAKIFEKYKVGSKYLPKYITPKEILITNDENFTKKFKNFIENEISLLLFDISVKSADNFLNITEYWGYMQFEAMGDQRFMQGLAMWPNAVFFTPAPIYNKQKGWKRKNKKEETNE